MYIFSELISFTPVSLNIRFYRTSAGGAVSLIKRISKLKSFQNLILKFEIKYIFQLYSLNSTACE